MQIRTPLLAIATAIALLTATGCAVTRGQETVGAYVDDAGITTLIRRKHCAWRERREDGQERNHHPSLNQVINTGLNFFIHIQGDSHELGPHSR